jgi:hypothetical protein
MSRAKLNGSREPFSRHLASAAAFRRPDGTVTCMDAGQPPKKRRIFLNVALVVALVAVSAGTALWFGNDRLRARIEGAIEARTQDAVTCFDQDGPRDTPSVTVRHALPSAQRPDGATGLHRLVYVFPDQAMHVYDMDDGHRLVKSVKMETRAVRGAVASAVSGMLYLSCGGDGGDRGNGSLLKYDLARDRFVWAKSYPFGIDSMAISADGRRIYMPEGEASGKDRWFVIEAENGRVLDSIRGGTDPHNTVVGPSGTRVYLGPKSTNYLAVADTRTNRVVKRVGPLKAGVRPFAVNGTETLVYTVATGFFGFQLSSLQTGRVLYTVPIEGFEWRQGTVPSLVPNHGITLSPDEKELYLIDSSNSYVHVYDVSRVPDEPPEQVADIKLTRPMVGDEEPCTYGCDRSGWVQHSRDGRFVYVGDSGDVIDTASRTSIANLTPLFNSREVVEIQWRDGRPVFSPSSRTVVGYVHG